jgi:thiol-disulfide isomerase/thioredoxin
MMPRLALLTLLALGGSPLPAQDAKPVLDPVATAIWSEHARGMGDRGEGRPGVNFDLVTGKAFEFFGKFPDERRVGGILFNLSSFGGWLGDDARSAGLRPAWQAHLRGAVADVLSQKNLARQRLGRPPVGRGPRTTSPSRLTPPGTPISAPLRQRIELIATRVPTSAYRTFLEQEYVRWLEQLSPDAVGPHLAKLAASDSEDLAKYGRGQLAIHQLRTTPMELTFTATDGTKVDLADYRGKVVLLDCWATWCVPCIKELPYVKAALAKWGPKGFAVIGLSFDRPGDKAKLVKFIADEQLTWPHWFYEGPGKNPVGLKYNIRSIPATFLLGRDGRLVTTETHGDKLEAALKKLLE